MDSRRLAPAAGAAGASPLGRWPLDRVCETCWNAAWVKDGHALIRCPECNGASVVARGSKATVAAMLARDHAETARMRAKLGLPPLGQRVVDLLGEGAPAPPPEGWAKSGVPVPTTVTEEQRERARQLLAGGIKAIAGKGGTR